MPVKLVCNCGKEIREDGAGPDSEVNRWLKKSLIGGILVLCPECQATEEDCLIEKEMELSIEIYVARATERARKEAEEKYTPDYVRQLRKERGGIIPPHFKQNTLNDFLLDKSKVREERPKDGILL